MFDVKPTGEHFQSPRRYPNAFWEYSKALIEVKQDQKRESNMGTSDEENVIITKLH